MELKLVPLIMVPVYQYSDVQGQERSLTKPFFAEPSWALVMAHQGLRPSSGKVKA
jgi:hypothetical protein